MKRFHKGLALLLALVMVFSLSVTALAEEEDVLVSPAPSGDEITILYTNDVHTYIDEDLTYSLVAAYRDTLDNVLLVDAGDHVQGTAYGSMDKGVTITKLMNAAGYDLATLGNHEFDYGMEGAMRAIEEADFPYVSCNFYHEENGVPGDSVLDSYQVFEVNGVKIAFVGITTPESFTKSTPKYFQDDEGNYIYGIAGGDDGSALYAAVQEAIDAASAEADIVIALGHLGDDPASDPWNSEDVIANTTGLDAFIDGHSHSTVEGKEIADKDGNPVVLTQTGSYLAALGQMTIAADGTITTRLLTAEDLAGIEPDADVKAIEDAWIGAVEEQLGTVIGSIDDTLDNYAADGTRLVRSQETNTGDFAADALYYLFDNMGLDVDFAIMNGGGVRNKAITGDISYKVCKDIHTFGNVACLQTITGQQILDALEWGARDAGVSECGGFLQVSGLKYTIDTGIKSTVQKDEKGVWTGGPTGEYRVKDVMVLDKETGEYVPLDVNAKYNLAGYNYTLRDLGDGYAMFAGAVNVLDYVMEDYMVLANYVQSFEDGKVTGYAEPQGRIEVLIHEPFADVSCNDWFYDYVVDLYEAGVIKGMTETTFVPEGELTWGQALKLLLVSTGVMEDAATTGDDWFAPYVEKAQELGLVESVDGAEIISRLDFCTVAAKLYELEPVAADFTDCDDGYVGALEEAGIIDGFAEADGSYTFRGEESLQRDHIAKIICMLMDLAVAE
ncbi:MAG: 5'-nucleotidase C-terminal domain-containing protein [Oscillospiraceae bacterium]